MGDFFLPAKMSVNYRNAIVFVFVSVIGLLIYRYLEYKRG